MRSCISLPECGRRHPGLLTEDPVLTGTQKIEIREEAVPEITDDEVLVKVEQVGICGTDVHEYKGDPFHYIPKMN